VDPVSAKTLPANSGEVMGDNCLSSLGADISPSPQDERLNHLPSHYLNMDLAVSGGKGMNKLKSIFTNYSKIQFSPQSKNYPILMGIGTRENNLKLASIRKLRLFFCPLTVEGGRNLFGKTLF
jgi:hypothetical protein